MSLAPLAIPYLLSFCSMNAARALRYARRRAGLTQRDLAVRAGVPQPGIARIESGVVSPRMDTLAHLMAAAGSTLELAPRIGEGVDRTMFAATLAQTPEQRIEAAGRAGTTLAAFRDEVRRGRTRA
jgi:predicted transcriptional regulator